MNPWSVNRWLVLVLVGVFACLMADTRFHHVRLVVHDIWGWVPIYFAGFMVAASFLTLLRWNVSTRRFFFWCSLVSIGVGYQGFFFHNKGRTFQAIEHVLSAWHAPTVRQEQAPALAPLTFSAFGIIGALASAERMQPKDSSK